MTIEHITYVTTDENNTQTTHKLSMQAIEHLNEIQRMDGARYNNAGQIIESGLATLHAAVAGRTTRHTEN